MTLSTRLTLLLLCTAPACASAQPTIGPGAITHLPGEQYTIAFCDSIGAGGAGAAQHWDFSMVAGCGTPASESWHASTGLTDFTYTVSQHWPTGGGIDFYNTDGNAYQLVCNGPLPNDSRVYSDPRDVMRYPMAFGGSFSDTYAGLRRTGPTVIDTIHGNCTVAYDAYGSITLPWGTVNEVFRIHTHDSIFYTPENFYNKVTDTYQFFQPGLPEALLSIVHTKSLTIQSTGGYSWMYLPDITGVAENSTSPGPVLYPDPVTDQAMLRTDARVSGVQAIDLSGRAVELPFTLERGAVRFDAAALASGGYTVVLSGPDGRIAKRFIKQ